MAVAHVVEFPIEGDDRSTTNYDSIAEKLREGPSADGLIFHTAGFDEDGGVFRVFDVWESREQAEALQERIMQLAAETQARPPSRDAYYELHDVVSP